MKNVWNLKTNLGQRLGVMPEAYYNEPVSSLQHCTQSSKGYKATYFIIEIADLKNVFNICYSICHTQVSLGIAQQYDITVVF